jgi:predicted dithiol-disulfide oxidoreductase (DUF899 family)
MAESLHSVRFPGESAEYREARNQLLQAEIDLRERMESVARLRRSLPRGGRVPQDYEFEEWNGSVKRRTKLSELFAAGKDSRHIDLLWPIWSLFDLTPEGRGEWMPKLAYDG